MSGERFAFGPFVMEPDRGVLTRDGVPVPAGARPMALLTALLRAGNAVAHKDDLLDAAWPATAVEASNLSVQVAALRKLLGTQPDGREWISTVPRVGYRFDGPIEASSGEAPSTLPRTLLAVLPFADATGTTEPLHSGLADDIATALSRFGWFGVTGGDHADAHYKLHGILRRSGDRLRLSAHVVDARADLRIFAASYDARFADAFAGTDEMIQRVAAAVEAALLKADGSRAQGNTPGELVKRGSGLFHRLTPSTHLAARELFRAASRLDPHSAEAWAWLARVHAGLLGYGWSTDPAADAAEGVAAGLAAVRSDPGSPYAHYGLAIVSIYADAPEQAVRAAERAVELNGSFALGHLVHGLALLVTGDAGAAAAALERGIALSPGDPQVFAWLNFLALARLFLGAADDALAAATQALQIRPDWRTGHETMVCCQVASGRMADARRSYARLANLSAETGGATSPIFAANPQWRYRMNKLLEKARNL